VKQYQGDPWKDFLNRFGALVVKLHTKDEAMMVHAFRRGMLSRPFSDSLTKCLPKTFSEIRRRVVVHIGAEEEVTKIYGSIGPTRPLGTGRTQPMRVHEATTEKKPPARQATYEPRKHQIRARTREGTTS